jgi:hypothetical protein
VRHFPSPLSHVIYAQNIPFEINVDGFVHASIATVGPKRTKVHNLEGEAPVDGEGRLSHLRSPMPDSTVPSLTGMRLSSTWNYRYSRKHRGTGNVCYFNCNPAHCDSLGWPFATDRFAGSNEATLICCLDVGKHSVYAFRGRRPFLSTTCGKVGGQEGQAASSSTSVAERTFVGAESYQRGGVLGEKKTYH